MEVKGEAVTEEKEDGPSKKCESAETPKKSESNNAAVASEPAGAVSTQYIITQMMDIEEPLSYLRTLLEPRLHCSLSDHEIHLQGASGLDPDKSLLEQGIKAEGTVQFSVHINSRHGCKPVINICDIVKPIIETVELPISQPQAAPTSETKSTSKSVEIAQDGQVTQLIVCNNYREEQEKNNIPLDPKEWTADQTEHWLTWAAAEFGLDLALKILKAFKVPGDKLCSLTREDFTSVLPSNSGDLFWTHLQVLMKTKDTTELTLAETECSSGTIIMDSDRTTGRSKPGRPTRLNSTSEDRILPSHRAGNNSQIQLWQFLLELLTDWKSLNCITWVGEEGEFKLLDAELVAQKWGERKGKNSMNYEKLSRALRYYYDGDMIAKVHGKRFVYKFVCNLKELIGFDAAELKRLVFGAQEKHGTTATVIRLAALT